MPRTARVAPGGMVFHVLNRGVARMQLFEKAADYQAFEQVLRDTLDQSPMRICAYAVMPNHWHLLLWPECDGELAAFMQRLTITHVRRWQEHRGYAGLGHVYQGRYKSFPVESDEHFWVVARYVERNALRANLVLRAEEWRWSSLWQRCHPTGEERSLLAAWPIDMPANWLERVNQTDDAQELEALRRSVQRGRPFGQPEWQKEIAKRLGLGACPNICSCSRMAAGFRWALAFSASAQPCARTIPLNLPRRCRSGARSSKDCGSSISVATRPTLSPGLATETCGSLART